MTRWKVRALFAAAGLLWSAAVQGEGLHDFRDGWLLPVSDRAAVLASVSSPAPDRAAGGGPREYPDRWGWWLGAGQGRLYSLTELPDRFVECGLLYRSGGRSVSLVVSWERLGQRLFLEDTKTLALQAGGRARFGARVRARNWSVQGQREDSGLEVSLRGGISFGSDETLAGKCDVWFHASRLPRWHGRGGRRTLAEVRLFHPGAGAAVRLDQKNDGVPVFSLEIMGRLSARVGLGWRVDPETGSMGGGLSARVAGMWLQTSHVVHPALGVTHRFLLGTGDTGVPAW